MTICKKAAFVGAIAGEACLECGHTNLVHPGTHNPSLTGCVLCVLVAEEGSRQLRISENAGAEATLPRYIEEALPTMARDMRRMR